MPAQAPANLAGKITRLIPVDFVVRQQKQLEAKKDMEVLWGDTIRTERGGRVRVELGDGSVLNVGSQSSLVIEKHDAASQDTALELVYGRVRANAVKIGRPEGGFKVRTKAAVAGIVGTEEYLEATDVLTTIIALGGGRVIVTSTDPRFPDPVVLDPGEAVTMTVARPPGRKRTATTEELSKAIQETEADPMVSLGRRQTAPGASFDTFISGRGLGSATAISTSHPGITVQTRGGGSAAQIPISIVVAPDVPTGTYTITVERPEGPARATLVVQAGQATQPGGTAPSAGAIPMPSPQSYSVIRGAKISVDGSQVRAPAGTQIVSYQWAVVNPQGQVVNQALRSSGTTFAVNTSLLPAGNYGIQLTVTSDGGATGSMQHPLTVQAGVQPFEIVRDLATAYESLQPSQFLRNFDQEKFRNYAGFAAAVEDSFRSKLQSMRVFQRPVNCAVIEEQDQAQCQAEFELQFSLKGDSTLRMGSESNTIRFERADAGWRVVDYSAVVSCPGGTATSGINVGSCIFATASTTAPSFQIFNLQLLTTDLLFGGSVPGSFDVVPTGGFNGNIQFSATGPVGNQSVSVQFSPNPSGPADRVNFTVFSPAAPMGFSGPLPFTLTITGQDGSGSVTASVSVPMTLQPDFSIQVSPTTSGSAPAPVTHNSNLQVTAQVVPGAGFTGSVFVDFPNLPAGFLATGGSVSTGTPTVFPVQVTSAAAPGPAQIILRATFGTGIVKTATVFADVVSDFTLNVTPGTSPANPLQVRQGASAPITVQIVPISGFAGTTLIDFPSPPTGVTVAPPNANVAAGASMPFTVQLAAGGPLGPAQLTVRGTFAGSVQLATVFLNLAPVPPPVQTGAGTRIGTAPEGSLSLSAPESPATLADAETSSFVKVAVQAESGFSGRVQLSLADVPERVVASVEPAQFELASGELEVVQVRLQATRPAAELNAGQPFAIRLIASFGSHSVETRVFIRAADTKSPTSANPPPGVPRRPVSVDETPARPVRRPAALDTPRDPPGAGAVPFPDPTARPSDATAPAKPQTDEPAAEAGPRTPAVQRLENAQVQIAAGGCAGFRFASGTQTRCGEGADLELNISPEGNSISFSAEGIRNLGAMTLDRVAAVPEGPLGTAEALQAGAAYVVQARQGVVVVRVSRVTGLGSRNAPPRPLRGPRVGASEEPAASSPRIVVFLEWKALSPR
jgi:hypothetical protein